MTDPITAERLREAGFERDADDPENWWLTIPARETGLDSTTVDVYLRDDGRTNVYLGDQFGEGLHLETRRWETMSDIHQLLDVLRGTAR